MKRPRIAFVVTVSMVGLAGCEKTSTGGGGECKPPDCHMNPPPQEPRALPTTDAAVPAASAK